MQMLLRSKRHSNKQPSCFFPSFGLPMLTLHMQVTTSIQQAKSAQTPSSGLSSSIRQLQMSVSVGQWARRASHLLGLSLLHFSMKCSTWNPGCRGMSASFAFRRGDALSAAPLRLVSLTAPQPVPRDGNYSPSCIAAEASVFPRTPSSGKARSSPQTSHLQSLAGKCSHSGKPETHPAASCSG